jgi:hypothetical protein
MIFDLRLFQQGQQLVFIANDCDRAKVRELFDRQFKGFNRFDWTQISPHCVERNATSIPLYIFHPLSEPDGPEV